MRGVLESIPDLPAKTEIVFDLLRSDKLEDFISHILIASPRKVTHPGLWSSRMTNSGGINSPLL